MRLIATLPLLALALVSCETPSALKLDESGLELAPTEQRGLGYVDIAEDWRMESEALTVTRDRSGHRVLRAGAQGGARLTSLRLPQHTQVPTSGSAEAIYYDAFQNRFELVGDPVLEQGSKVTQKFGPEASIVMYSDGTLLVKKRFSLIEEETEK